MLSTTLYDFSEKLILDDPAKGSTCPVMKPCLLEINEHIIDAVDFQVAIGLDPISIPSPVFP